MMPSLTHSITLLLAQTQRDPDKQTTLTTVTPSDVSDKFNQGIKHDIPWELLLVGIGATLTAIVIVSLRRRWLGRHKDPGPMVLYSAIARKAGLTWRDRVLLWRISKTFNLPTPITLMLARGTLRHYRELYLSNRAAGTHQRLNQRLARIELVLFG